jgi:hypothetical protein
MKKKQQEHLQHLLASNNEAHVVQPARTVILNTPKPSTAAVSNHVVSYRTVIAETNNNENTIPEKPVAQPPAVQQKLIESPVEQSFHQLKPNPNNKMNLDDLARLIVNKSPIINNEMKERIDNLKLKSLIKVSKATSLVTSSQNTTTTTTANMNAGIRPKIFVSKQTNQKLQQIAIDKFANNITINNKLSVKPQTNVTTEKFLAKNRENANLVAKNLSELIDNLTKEYPYVHLSSSSISFKDLIVNKEFKTYFNNLNENLMVRQSLFQKQDDVRLSNVLAYESPLSMFRGYRFNKNFCDFNKFETAYSKFFCHSIDIRKPFCPFDLNGSCKDSNCI